MIRPLLLAGAVLAVAAVAQVGAALAGAPLAPVVWDSLDVVALVLAGAWTWRRAPGTRTGPLLVLTGLAIGLSVLVYLEDAPVLRLVGMVALPLFAPPLVLALLGFPSGRVEGLDRTIVLGALAATTAGWWVVLLTYAPPPGVSTIAMPFADRATSDVLATAHWAGCALVGPVVAWRLVRRWRVMTPAARRVRAPVVVSGAAMALVTAAATPFAVQVLDGRPPPAVVLTAWGLGFAAVPVAMLVTLVRQHATRAPIGVVLGALDPAGGGRSVRDAVAAALGDPTLELVARAPGGAWRRPDGRPPALSDGRVLTPIGRRAALVHDAVLLEDPLLLETIAATAGLALEHERLTAEVRARLEEAGAVRARIVRASDDARRGIERDLHDGAQQTLVSLALALGMVEEELETGGDDLAVRLVRHAAAQAEAALAELRELARGVFPALLGADGLAPALEELAAAAPLGVALDVALPGRLAPEVEAAAWFLVREGLVNAHEHGRARSAMVRARIADGRLLVEVVDDGAGGAAIVPGGALEQLADRVAALGGRLEVGEAPGAGTRLAAALDAGARPPAPPAASVPRAVPSG